MPRLSRIHDERRITTTNKRTQITLTLEGSRAEHGVSLSDFESFIEGFLTALRGFDCEGRGVSARKSGHPERRDEAVTAFRLVRFEPGSGIATIEPGSLASSDDEQLPFDDIPLAVENLRALVDKVEDGTEISEAVSDALSKACRTLGSDGSIRIDFPNHIRTQPGAINLPKLGRLGGVPRAETEEAQTVSGRLHLLDVEPDKLAIRTSSDMDWICSYPEQLETSITRLVGQIVWAQGSGHLTSPQRGTMTIERIEPAGQADQSPLFTVKPISDADLLISQGIRGPQGLGDLADPEWDDETDSAYLAALTGA